MDELEKLILDKKELLNAEEPLDGHFNRFRNKLEAEIPNQNKWKHRFYYAASIAAVLAVFLFVVQPSVVQKKQLALHDLSDQYANVENYYTNAISKQQSKLVFYTQNQTLDDESAKMIKKELAEFDEVFKQISEDLNLAPSNPAVINALINYYQNKLNIINKILDEIESKKEMEENHENIRL